MNLKHLKLLVIALACFSFLFILAPAVHAQFVLPECTKSGYCTLCDILQVVINFGKFLLGIVGSLALLMFVYGGFMWLTSGGESGKIDAGKKILVNSVIGIGITFFAWVVVSFVVTTLTASSGWDWSLKLTCAPLVTELPRLDIKDRWADTSGTGTKKEGDTCTHSSECSSTLYCDKSTTKCVQKIATANKIPGVSTPAATDKKCRGMEIEGKDNMACQSGNCTRDFTGLKCPFEDYCCVTGNVEGGESCTADSTCTAGTYCEVNAADASGKTGTCKNQRPNGQPCGASFVVGGNADKMCTGDACVNHFCVPSMLSLHTGTVDEGGYCQDNTQCKNACAVSPGLLVSIGLNCGNGEKLYCYSVNASSLGICKKGPIAPDGPCQGTIVMYGVDDANAPCTDGYHCELHVSTTISGIGKCIE